MFVMLLSICICLFFLLESKNSPLSEPHFPSQIISFPLSCRAHDMYNTVVCRERNFALKIKNLKSLPTFFYPSPFLPFRSGELITQFFFPKQPMYSMDTCFLISEKYKYICIFIILSQDRPKLYPRQKKKGKCSKERKNVLA